MFTLYTYVLVKCMYFIVWMSDGQDATAFAQFQFALLCSGRYIPSLINSVYALLAFYVYVFAHS